MDFSDLMELSLKFRESKCFFVSLKLGVFDLLSSGAKTAAEAAQELSIDRRASEILLNALVSLRLLKKQDGYYSDTDITRQFLTKGGADYRGAIFNHLDSCWEAWSDFENTVRSGSPKAEFSAYKADDANDDFIWGMDNVGKTRAQDVLKAVDFSRFTSMLDLGCGAATYSIAFARRNPGLQVTALDLDISLRVARENVAGQGVEGQFDFIGGDFLTVDWGNGYDLIWASQFIHCFGENETRWLLENAYNRLPAGGQLMIHDFLLDEDKTSPPYGAIFSIHMLAATEQGRSYSAAELTGWMTEIGFKTARQVKVNETSSVLTAIK